MSAAAETRSPGIRLPNPPLPLGQRVDLPGRGTAFFREVAGPPGAPTVVLLHGWIASAGLNWFQVFEPLGRYFRVVAPDLRGHGRGIRGWRRFRLEDCADDTAALLREIEAGPVIAVGYSMGGPVAQLLWRRHRELVSGLVLCATAEAFVLGVRERFVFTSAMAALSGTTRLGQLLARLPRSVIGAYLPPASGRRPGTLARWAAQEMGRHDVRMLLEAGGAIGRYDARRWIHQIDVPTAVLVTDQDRALLARSQLGMALRIPDAAIHRLEAGHVACASAGFAAPLVRACRDVADRARRRR